MKNNQERPTDSSGATTDDFHRETLSPSRAVPVEEADSTYESIHASHSDDILAEDDFDDEGYSESLNSGELTSLASSIHRGVFENGRLYPNYGKHEYGMPMDERELERNDIQHTKYLLLLNDQLCMTQLDSPSRILDVGTGTGIWAIDMGDLHPQAQIIGTDIAPIQPSWLPPNVQFIIEDAEADWSFSPGTFDIVFSRETSFAIRDWPKFISQAWSALKPGGHLELGSTAPRTHCDDGSLDLKTSYFVETVGIYYNLAQAMGTSLDAPFSWAQQMREAGFVNIQEHSVKMPMGPWAKDKRLKKVGILERAQLDQGYEAYMMRGWTQVLKKPAEELYPLIAEARKEISNRKHHTYAHFIVVTGQKPGLR